MASQNAPIEAAKSFLVGLAVLIVTAFVWEFLIAINARVLRTIPVAAVGAAIYAASLWSLLRPTWTTRSLSFPKGLATSVWLIAFTGILGSITLMIFLAAIWPYKLAALERASLTTFQLQFSFAVIGPGLAAFVEEVVFRGVLQPRLERVFGVSAGILVCSLLFTLAHAGNIEFSVQACSYFIASIYFGIVAWRTSSLFVSVIGHVALNVAGNAVVFFVGPVNSSNWSTAIAWLAGITTVVAFSGFIWLLRRDRVLAKA